MALGKARKARPPRRSPATPSPRHRPPPAAAPHSARQRAGVIKATSNRGEDSSARSLLIGAPQAHGAGLSISPCCLVGGGGCRALCQRSPTVPTVWGGGGGTLSWSPRQHHPPSCGHLSQAETLAFQTEWHWQPLHGSTPQCQEKQCQELGENECAVWSGRDVAFQS